MGQISVTIARNSIGHLAISSCIKTSAFSNYPWESTLSPPRETCSYSLGDGQRRKTFIKNNMAVCTGETYLSRLLRFIPVGIGLCTTYSFAKRWI